MKNLLFILLLIGCSRDNNSIYISGSSTVSPIVIKAVELYQKSNPTIRIYVNGGGSSVGINEAISGRVDIGMSSKTVSTKNQNKLNIYVLARDAVAAVVSFPVYNSGIKSLTRQQIADIYSGKIHNWSDLGGFDKEILCIDKEPNRGTRAVFMKYITGDKNAKAEGADLVTGSNNEKENHLANNDNAIGMLSFAWLSGKVRALGIVVHGRAIYPNALSVNDGTYPISRELLILTQKKMTPQAKQFLDFLFSNEVKKIIRESDFLVP